MQNINWEEIFFKFRYPILAFLAGLILVGVGVFWAKGQLDLSWTKVEVLEATTEGQVKDLVIEVRGAVEKPGVYKLSTGSRTQDALVAAGGLSISADRTWVDKNLNRAAKISDGQKIFIPFLDQRSDSLSAKNNDGYQSVSRSFSSQGSGLININTASGKELDGLPGIGPAYAQNIIDHRPYSNVEELLTKSVLKKTVYDKIKDLVTVY